MLAAVPPIEPQGPVEDIARSTVKPVSFIALSVQLKLIWFDETALAARLLGAAGGVPAVVALAVFEKAEARTLPVARTR